MKMLIEEIEVVIDKELQVKHCDLSKKIEAMLEDKKAMSRLGEVLKLNPEFADLCYSPVIQSGGVYDVNPYAKSNEENLSSNIIICKIGGDYRNYKSNIIRTLIIDATRAQKENYIILNKLKNEIIKALQPGFTLESVFQTAIRFLEKEKPELVKHLPKCFGNGVQILIIFSSHITRSASNTKKTF